jgi:glycosyltransferase involved in cell wall biosynthesis
MSKVDVSLIIPTFNEEDNIRETIIEWEKALANFNYEILVIDNGSNDRTIEIAEELADKCLTFPAATVGGLRNFGSDSSSGDILIFNDADVRPGNNWTHEFNSIFSSVLSSKLIIGGHLRSSLKDNWIYKYWFQQILESSKTDVNYVGTGHMIMSKKTFDDIGGFNNHLITGEDYDICCRCKNAIGGQILLNKRLEVIHDGYPTSLRSLFLREHWHGQGDTQSLSTFFSSKIAVLATMYTTLALASLASFGAGAAFASLIFFILAITLLLLSSFYKFRKKMGPKGRTLNLALFSVYLLARSCSIINPKTLKNLNISKRN